MQRVLTAIVVSLAALAAPFPALPQTPSPSPAPRHPGPASPAKPSAGPGDAQAWCDGVCAGNASCAAMCAKSPYRKVTFTADSIPVGTPVKLHFISVSPNGVNAGLGSVGETVEDTVLGDGVVIKKGSQVWARYVAGGIRPTATGSSCDPITIAMATALPSIAADGGVPSALAGVQLANWVQRVPLSFADPKTGGSAMVIVPFPICASREIYATAYVTGPPTAPQPPGR